MMLITYTTISVVNMPKPCQSGTEFTLTLGPNYHSSLVPRPLTQKERVWYISSVYFFYDSRHVVYMRLSCVTIAARESKNDVVMTVT